MVNSGKPSTGCRNCRQRHIKVLVSDDPQVQLYSAIADQLKCDETRPHCRACTRTNRSCPGYPDPFDLVLRDHTQSFQRSKPDRTPAVNSRSSPDQSSIITQTKEVPYGRTSRSVAPANRKLTGGSWPPSFGPADLYLPMEDTVIPLFFNPYLYLPKDRYIRNNFMEMLPAKLSSAKSGSHLHVSTLAVAFFSVAAWTGQGCLLRASEKYFTQALSRIREALQRDEECDLESLLLSTLLLSTYEVSTKHTLRDLP